MSLSTVVTDPDRKVLQGQVAHQTCWGKAVNQKMAILQKMVIEGQVWALENPPLAQGVPLRGWQYPSPNTSGKFLTLLTWCLPLPIAMVKKMLGEVEFFWATATDSVPLLTPLNFIFLFKATQLPQFCFSPVFADVSQCGGLGAGSPICQSFSWNTTNSKVKSLGRPAHERDVHLTRSIVMQHVCKDMQSQASINKSGLMHCVSSKTWTDWSQP